VLRFPPGGLPEARSFRSVTLYDEHDDLAANEINRYSRGSQDADLRYGADRSLELYLQAGPPPEKQRANWLPAPKGPFNLFVRAYLPDESLIKQTYVPPPVVRQQ